MYILALNNFYKSYSSAPTVSSDNYSNSQKFGLKMSAPLQYDTIAFGMSPTTKKIKKRGKGINPDIVIPTAKRLKKRGKGVNLKTARIIHEEIKKAQVEIEKFMRGIFAPYIVTEDKPDNLIEFISGRAKLPGSIVEKSDILELSTVQSVFHEMTDLNAMKAVLLNANRENVHKVLDVLSEAINHGFLILEEVEVKRPKAAKKLKGNQVSKYDYADLSYLQDFVDDAEKAMGKKIRFPDPQYHPINYTAIHFLFRLPGQKRVFEFQLMGHNVSVFKDLDDILFKVMNNKNVDEKYKPLVDILKEVTMSEDDKDIVKYAKIKDKIEKLKFDSTENRVFLNRLALNNELLYDDDSKEYKEKIQSLLRSKDINKEDLKMLIERAELEADYQDKETLKMIKQKAERYEKFNDYRAQAFLFQREKKVVTKNSDIEYFLPLSVDLPHQFDLNELNKIYRECKKN